MSLVPRSLRARLGVAMSLGFTLLVIAIAAVALQLLEGHATAQFDAGLLARAQGLAALTEQEDGRIEFDYVARFFPEFEREAEPEYFEFRFVDGTTLLRSRHLDETLLPGATTVADRRLADLALATGRRVRVLACRFAPKNAADGPPPATAAEVASATPPPALEVVLAVARGREPLDAVITRMRWTVLVAGAGATLLAWWIARVVVGRGLRPIDALSAQVRMLRPDEPGARVRLPEATAELEPVVAQLNALLARWHAAMQRERRFSANVAHELRTPVTELRALAGVGVRWPEDREAVAGYFADVDRVAERMQDVIADLLLLARCQAGREACVRKPVALRRVLESAWSARAVEARERGLGLRLELDPRLAIDSDPGKLETVCANLIGNAIHHATPGTVVRARARLIDGAVELAIENAAAQLPAGGIAHLREPFWQGDAARAASDRAGIGLALVDALVRLLGIELAFAQDPDGTFRVTLTAAAAAGTLGRGRLPGDPAFPRAPEVQGEAS